MPYEFSGDRLAEAIKRAGKTQRSLSEELGWSEPAISLYKLGYRTPPPSKLVALAFALDVNVEEFFVEVHEEVAAQ
jgi:transcriptional regulator with XRE-family HTH domain